MMTTDNMGATLLDDNCLEDIFTMQSHFLDDFEFGLEANNIDTLLELFEEEEYRHKDATKADEVQNVVKSAVEGDNQTQIKVSMAKVSKSKTNNSSDVTVKRKGTSLLAKPKKSPAKKPAISMSDGDIGSLSCELLKDHDYCLMDGKRGLYNKLPDYLTEFSSITKAITSSANYSQIETYDKIPNYIKGFRNLNETIDSREDFTDNDDILLELNEAYIEVSDVVFDNDLYSIDKTSSQLFGEDFNSNSSDSSSPGSSFKEAKDNFKGILSDDNSAQCKQQLVSSYSSDSNDDKSSDRRSRSRSREQSRSYRNRRRRRLSTRSSVDSNSDSSSSCSSCSECGSYSSRNSDESKVNYNLSNSIIRNDTKGQQLNRKRSLKESFCQKSFRSKIRPNFDKSYNENVINIKSKRKSDQDIEERKIIYIGKIPDGTTKTDIRCWFGRFGAIKEVSIHFRDRGDNYAFVTFHRRTDAFEAIERKHIFVFDQNMILSVPLKDANDDTRHPKFDLSFGGRRQFCKTRYEDLDFAEDGRSVGYNGMDFDSLLRSTQQKLTR